MGGGREAEGQGGRSECGEGGAGRGSSGEEGVWPRSQGEEALVAPLAPERQLLGAHQHIFLQKTHRGTKSPPPPPPATPPCF